MMYSPITHGTSISTLYRQISNYDAPTLIIIQDSNKNKFGAFTSETWKQLENFYGNGESFLYTFKTTDSISVYKWTQINQLFMHSNANEGLCLGAGEYYGFFIHKDLEAGYSFPCDTYGNDFLTQNKQKDFIIEKFEIWQNIGFHANQY